MTWLRYGLFSIIILIAWGLFLEGCLRIYSALAYPKMMILDEHLGWRHAARVSKVFTNEDGTKALVVQNKYGHRGSEYALQRHVGKKRIMFLGDSFTEGSQVNEEELFTALLERGNSSWEIINAGVGGYGTVQEYLYLVKEGLQFHPDMVVLMVYENDFLDNCLPYYPSMGPRPYAQWKERQLYIVEKLDWSAFRKFGLPAPFQDFLHANSYLYYFVNTRAYQVILAESLKELEKSELRRVDTCARLEVFSEVITKVAAALRSIGSSLSLVAIPTSRDIALGRSATSAVVDEVCTSHHLGCLDLLPPFTATPAQNGLTYFPIDIHWTRVGHEVAAKAIHPFLISSLATLHSANAGFLSHQTKD